MQRVAVIDYGMGNLSSVSNAFLALGTHVEIIREARRMSAFTHIVLPGVGAFGDGIDNLQNGGWIPELECNVLREQKPFLGICLGMQLLAETGTENGHWRGLGWIKGSVSRLSSGESGLRIPHIGWNDVVPARGDATYSKGFSSPGVFYFVHSYHFVVEETHLVNGWCEYGTKFAASLAQNNIWGVQYHPEKSQKAGLQVLSNYLSQKH